MSVVTKASEKRKVHMPNSRNETGTLQKISKIKETCFNNGVQGLLRIKKIAMERAGHEQKGFVWIPALRFATAGMTK